MQKIIEQLRQIREERGISRNDLLDRIGSGVSERTLASAEQGRVRSIQLSALLIWADALGYEVTLAPKPGFVLGSLPDRVAVRQQLKRV